MLLNPLSILLLILLSPILVFVQVTELPLISNFFKPTYSVYWLIKSINQGWVGTYVELSGWYF